MGDCASSPKPAPVQEKTGSLNEDWSHHRLMLVSRGDPDAIRFDREFSKSSGTAARMLTLSSHPGAALKCNHAERDFHGFKYIEMGVTSNIQDAAWGSYDGQFITLKDSDKVFDTSMAKMDVGSHVNFVRDRVPANTRQGSHRSFVIESDGTVAAKDHKHLVLGIRAPPKRLVLVNRGSQEALKFDRLRANNGDQPLTVQGGKAIVYKDNNSQENDWGGYKYHELALGSQDQAIRARYDGEFVTLANDDKVFDVSHWKYHAGNTVNFVRDKNPAATRSGGGGRSWNLDADGTMSVKSQGHMVLGFRKI